MPVRILRFFILLFAILVSYHIDAQTYKINGIITDSLSGAPLAFVSVQINNSTDGCMTDIDGKFSYSSQSPIKKLNISYIGYNSKEYFTSVPEKTIRLQLQPIAYELSQIVILSGVNPAHRIIREVLANRYLNDHEHLPSFSYTSYEKMVFGPETDSIPVIDSLASDTSYQKAREFFRANHLFIMENVLKRKFRFPNDNYNQITASRISGVSDPLFIFLISQIQSTSFYHEIIKIADKEYINPISTGCFSKYFFEINDTIIEPFPYDTTYIVSYRPKKNTNFNGLKGTLSISTNNYAIRNVIAVPADEEGMISVKIQQLYSFVNNSHWFPEQLNTDLIFKNIAVTFDSIPLKVVGRGKSYISDVNLNPGLGRSDFGPIELDVLPDAITKDAQIWDKYRVDTLTQRELNTYHLIDSLGKANHIDGYTRKLDALLNGRINVGPIDIYIDDILKLNRHEGTRLGLKISTSDKLNHTFKITGYTAYGFKDKAIKYGVSASGIVNRTYASTFTIKYYTDVDEAGADNPFQTERSTLNPERFRELMVDRMDRTRQVSAGFSSRLRRHFSLAANLATYTRQPLYQYEYLIHRTDNMMITKNNFRFTEASFGLRFAYGEKYLQNKTGTMSVSKPNPDLQLSIIHGFDNLIEGQFAYNRLEMSGVYFQKFKYLGTSRIHIKAGFIDRDAPYPVLFNAKAAYRPFSLYSPGNFATMRMNEFTSDRYLTVALSHSFGNLLFKGKHFKPEPELVTNIGFGKLSHPENHIKDGIKDFGKGYYESGIVLNSLLNLGITKIGFGWLYRYGPYSLPKQSDNMAWNLVFEFIM
jgi:hypothetical protein